jgi:hypothetical protein
MRVCTYNVNDDRYYVLSMHDMILHTCMYRREYIYDDRYIFDISQIKVAPFAAYHIIAYHIYPTSAGKLN